MRASTLFTGALLSSATLVAADCSTVLFNLQATADNAVFASPPDPANETEVIQLTLASFRGTPPVISGTTSVSGNFTITGTYCTPPDQSKNTLQILVHGITYSREYWSGFGVNPANNWHLAANNRGYATLAIDRLGHGSNPQRPDPLTVVQPQIQIELLHQLFVAIRSQPPKSPINPLGRSYNKLVFVGHSYGSALGNTLARQYPSDADALVLTAYTSSLNFTPLAIADWTPLSRHTPSSGNLPLGYLTLANQTERTLGFYSGNFDPSLPVADFLHEDSLTSGEAGAISTTLIPNTNNYTKPIFLATGAQDALLCATTAELCEEILKKTRVDFFPGLQDDNLFGFVAPDKTGHDVHLHSSAGMVFGAVHDFLDAKL